MENVDKLAGKLLELGEKLAEPAANLALTAVQVSAFGSFAAGGLGLALILLAVWLGRKAYALAHSTPDKEPAMVAFGGGAVTAGFFGLMLFALTWLDPWLWTALFRPELYLAKKALGL